MNFLYNYIQAKIIDKIIVAGASLIYNISTTKTINKISDLYNDTLWNKQMQIYYLGDHYITISGEEEEEQCFISTNSVDEKNDA